MTLREFADVVNHIQKNNTPFAYISGKVPCVKYMDPVFDFRTGTVFSIKFRGFGSEHVLHCQNECRELKESLFERCMAYLKGETSELPDARSVSAA